MLYVALSLWREVLPDNFEGLFWVIGRDGWSGLFALKHDLDELGLVLSVAVIGEPIVEVLSAEAPTMLHSLRTIEGHSFDVGNEDGLGGR